MSVRVSQALLTGGLNLPDGRVAVLHPGADADLTGLPKHQIQIVQPFFPDYELWRSRGFACVAELQGTFVAAIVFLPRAKALARALIAAACDAADLVVVDGAKSNGIDSILKDVRARMPVSGPISKSHGKIFWFNRSSLFSDWAGQVGQVGDFETAPGVFSADGIDSASALLADMLPDDLGRRVADLGAGWGYLSARALSRQGIEALHVVEADHAALACARANLRDARAQFHWADATCWQPAEPVNTVIMNPPFHINRTADSSLGQAFIQAAAGMLTANGTLWMVANRHLPYETVLRKAFKEGDEFAGNTRFKLFRASRPVRSHR